MGKEVESMLGGLGSSSELQQNPTVLQGFEQLLEHMVEHLLTAKQKSKERMASQVKEEIHDDEK